MLVYIYKYIYIYISSNKDNNDNINNNDLKDGQNDRLKKKETLIRIRNWSGLYTFEE